MSKETAQYETATEFDQLVNRYGYERACMVCDVVPDLISAICYFVASGAPALDRKKALENALSLVPSAVRKLHWPKTVWKRGDVVLSADWGRIWLVAKNSDGHWIYVSKDSGGTICPGSLDTCEFLGNELDPQLAMPVLGNGALK